MRRIINFFKKLFSKNNDDTGQNPDIPRTPPPRVRK